MLIFSCFGLQIRNYVNTTKKRIASKPQYNSADVGRQFKNRWFTADIAKYAQLYLYLPIKYSFALVFIYKIITFTFEHKSYSLLHIRQKFIKASSLTNCARFFSTLPNVPFGLAVFFYCNCVFHSFLFINPTTNKIILHQFVKLLLLRLLQHISLSTYKVSICLFNNLFPFYASPLQ